MEDIYYVFIDDATGVPFTLSGDELSLLKTLVKEVPMPTRQQLLAVEGRGTRLNKV